LPIIETSVDSSTAIAAWARRQQFPENFPAFPRKSLLPSLSLYRAQVTKTIHTTQLQFKSRKSIDECKREIFSRHRSRSFLKHFSAVFVISFAFPSLLL
jgi:hypothetical protein